MKAAEYFNGAPDAWGGVTLTPKSIQVCDAAAPLRIDLAQVDQAVRPALEQCLREANALIRASNTARGSRTSDEGGELLKAVSSEGLISLGGTYPAGNTGGSPQLDAKMKPVIDFVTPFTPPNILRALDPGTKINLAKVYLPGVEDEEKRKGLELALDEAEKEWKADPRCGDAARARAKDAPLLPPTNLVAKTFGAAPGSADTASDLPPHERTKDAMTTRSLLFGSARTADFAAGLAKARAAAQGVTAPAKVATVADYARNLAAGRAARR
jgi:hypothetical protein